MLERILNSKNFVSFVLAAVTGTVLYIMYPFPSANLYLQLIAIKDPTVYSAIFWTYSLLLFTTPGIVYSSIFSALYIFGYRNAPQGKLVPLEPYPAPHKRGSLFLILGEQHHQIKFGPCLNPRWLKIPERGLYTGTMIIGAMGSGKTTGAMRPAADQLLGFKCHDPEKRISGLVLEVKGDFCHQVRDILHKYGREEDYVEIALGSEYRYNPLHNDLDAYAMAYGIATMLNNMFGKGKEPFWQQAYTNLVKFIILLHKILYDYVTLFDIYECAISSNVLENKLKAARKIFKGKESILVSSEAYRDFKDRSDNPADGLVFDEQLGMFRADYTRELEETLGALVPPVEFRIHAGPAPHSDPIKVEQFEAIDRWYYNDWTKIENKLRSNVVEGISVFLSLFDDNPHVKRLFCPPKETYDPQLNIKDREGRYKYGKPLPSFSWLIEEGKVCALNFPISLNAGLARAIGTMMKMDFQRAVLLRIPEMVKHPGKHFRPTLFLCDEYQSFATVGENDPSGDEKFFSLSRQARCVPIVATQSISSLQSTLPGESYRTLMQTFRTKIFLALSDEFSMKKASELCGQEDRPFITYTITESGQNSNVSLLTGKTTSDKDSISASKNYSLRKDFRFQQKVFAELANAQAIVIPYDGFQTKPATICYLKPCFLDPDISYFEQVKRGWL